MPPENRQANLVFQGGGVRAIAHVGAINAKPPHIAINAVAGTSGGSIVAALLAIGKSAEEVRSIMLSHDFAALLTKTDLERKERLWSFAKEARELFEKYKAREFGWRDARKAREFLKHLRVAWKDINDIWAEKGMFDSTPLRLWLNNLFGNRKFKDIVITDLRIVAADVSKREYVVYSRANALETDIAEAVHKSVNIPGFFRPFLAGTNYFVDGGVLSNFPSFVFVNPDYPTIGFRLLDVQEPPAIESTTDFLRALLLTMTEAHDKARAQPKHFSSYPIKTPHDIFSTKFHLKKEDINTLFEVGYRVGKEDVDWERYSSPRRIVAFYDPKPDEVLDETVRNARQVYNIYADQSLWVDKLERDIDLEFRIDSDWSTSYDRTIRLAVTGPRALVFTRSVQEPSSPGGFEEFRSLADLEASVQEITDGEIRDLPRIPAYNTQKEKGFLVIYVPPVATGKQRVFRHRTRIEKEFAPTLGKNFAEQMGFEVRQLARDDQMKLKFRVLVHSSLLV